MTYQADHKAAQPAPAADAAKPSEQMAAVGIVQESADILRQPVRPFPFSPLGPRAAVQAGKSRCAPLSGAAWPWRVRPGSGAVVSAPGAGGMVRLEPSADVDFPLAPGRGRQLV